MQLTQNIRYASYMLRLQLTQNADCPIWIVSMESTKTGEMRWFPNLDVFIQFMQGEFGNNAQAKELLSIIFPEIAYQTSENLETDIGANE